MLNRGICGNTVRNLIMVYRPNGQELEKEWIMAFYLFKDDPRYTLAQENVHGGYVLRFNDKIIGQSFYRSDMVMLALGHYDRQFIGPVKDIRYA